MIGLCTRFSGTTRPYSPSEVLPLTPLLPPNSAASNHQVRASHKRDDLHTTLWQSGKLYKMLREFQQTGQASYTFGALVIAPFQDAYN